MTKFIEDWGISAKDVRWPAVDLRLAKRRHIDAAIVFKGGPDILQHKVRP